MSASTVSRARSRAPKIALAVGYWLLAAAFGVYVLWHMARYLHVPNGGTFDVVAQQVRRGWHEGDKLLFSPSWLQGYAFDRMRYADLAGGVGVVPSFEAAPPTSRVWVIFPVWDPGIAPPDMPPYDVVSSDEVGGEVHVELWAPRALTAAQ